MKSVPIIITEEILGDDVEFAVTAEGTLDLASGDIIVNQYFIAEKDDDENIISKTPYDVATQGLPCKHPDYNFTSGLLKIVDKELEFAIDVNKSTGLYEVNADELEELKPKALALASKKSTKKP